MKNVMRVSIVLFLVFLIACQAENQESNEQEEPVEEAADTSNSTEATETNEEAVEETSETEEPAENQDQTDDVEVTQPVSEPLYKVSENWSLVPLEEGTNENVVLLTIDDAPEQYTLEMAKTLKELEAPAIFFVNGHFLETEEQKDILRQIHEMGFAIGNHTYNHQRLTEADEATQEEEIRSLSVLIEEIIGEKPEFFRAPNGANTDFATSLVEQEGMLLMNWTYGYDYFEPYMDADKLKTAMITGEGPEVDVPYSLLKPGAILLMHDREWTSAALADIVKGLREKGYEFADPSAIKLP
ncbi:polysaccharide deacetylase family protein [Gracilibacillus oryzae]|uniref:Polysaccharide deacetylase family protein n=1 Tax=Gracilibacillus oryzae TaxID=1672701 RepID=A0A7C8GUX3_9BACI|nr:polysaccharide deacetylase family protein [Gracilibacillus oryzae]KAB8138609.1 polysaccharide deacetylase family protein [Gracilibacillus oryzae]